MGGRQTKHILPLLARRLLSPTIRMQIANRSHHIPIKLEDFVCELIYLINKSFKLKRRSLTYPAFISCIEDSAKKTKKVAVAGAAKKRKMGPKSKVRAATEEEEEEEESRAEE